MKTNGKRLKGLISRKKLFIGIAALAAVLLIVILLSGKSGDTEGKLTLYTVDKGDLVIDVLEPGTIEASDSVDIRCGVERGTTIISIIPEGTTITEKDVEEKKILVELDSAQLKTELAQQEITVQSAEANLTDALESYKIQENQNESNLKEGELKVNFAKMDIEKYLGEKLAMKFFEAEIDLSSLFKSEELGGEALQKKREYENNISLAEEKLKRAEEKYNFTTELEAKGYVTLTEMQADELALKQERVNLERTSTSLVLFERYEIRKEAERLRTDYEKAENELERIKAKNRSEIAKADARRKSNEATYQRQMEILNKLKEQIEECTIVATKPGLIVYAGSSNPYMQQNLIKEGAQVRFRKEIIRIPNTSSMIAKTGIHESSISLVKKKQKAAITCDAFPDMKLRGTVKKVAPLPDSQDRFLNPNLKVFKTDVTIQGNNPELRPGMSCQVQIIINELKDVLMVPLQGVTTHGDQSICFVMTSSGPRMRAIRTGDYDDEFIVIKNGLEEGEKVALNASELLEQLKPPLPERPEWAVEEEPVEELEEEVVEDEPDEEEKEESEEDIDARFEEMIEKAAQMSGQDPEMIREQIEKTMKERNLTKKQILEFSEKMSSGGM